jgi:hypothetical protein
LVAPISIPSILVATPGAAAAAAASALLALPLLLL